MFLTGSKETSRLHGSLFFLPIHYVVKGLNCKFVSIRFCMICRKNAQTHCLPYFNVEQDPTRSRWEPFNSCGVRIPKLKLLTWIFLWFPLMFFNPWFCRGMVELERFPQNTRQPNRPNELGQTKLHGLRLLHRHSALSHGPAIRMHLRWSPAMIDPYMCDLRRFVYLLISDLTPLSTLRCMKFT